MLNRLLSLSQATINSIYAEVRDIYCKFGHHEHGLSFNHCENMRDIENFTFELTNHIKECYQRLTFSECEMFDRVVQVDQSFEMAVLFRLLDAICERPECDICFYAKWDGCEPVSSFITPSPAKDIEVTSDGRYRIQAVGIVMFLFAQNYSVIGGTQYRT